MPLACKACALPFELRPQSLSIIMMWYLIVHAICHRNYSWVIGEVGSGGIVFRFVSNLKRFRIYRHEANPFIKCAEKA